MVRMTFEDWIAEMKSANKVPFGTAYELFAQEAWNAATNEANKWPQTKDAVREGAAKTGKRCDGMIGKANVEARVAFLEQQWVASQGIIGILLAKLSDEEKAREAR